MVMDDDDLRNASHTISQSLGNLTRRLRQTRAPGGLSWRESSALSQLVRHGPATSAELARAEAISPQSMGATLGALEGAGLISRAGDPDDGRRVVFSATGAGERFYVERVDARTEQMAQSLADEFDDAELTQLLGATPLLDRLAQRIATDARRSPGATRRPRGAGAHPPISDEGDTDA